MIELLLPAYKNRCFYFQSTRKNDDVYCHCAFCECCYICQHGCLDCLIAHSRVCRMSPEKCDGLIRFPKDSEARIIAVSPSRLGDRLTRLLRGRTNRSGDWYLEKVNLR